MKGRKLKTDTIEKYIKKHQFLFDIGVCEYIPYNDTIDGEIIIIDRVQVGVELCDVEPVSSAQYDVRKLGFKKFATCRYLRKNYEKN